MKALETQHNASSFSEEGVPLALYQSTLAEVDHLYARVIALETFHSEFNPQCMIRDRRTEEEIASSTRSIRDCMKSLENLSQTHEDAMIDCKNTLVQLEIEQIQVIEKIEIELDGKFSNLLNLQSDQLSELEGKLSIMQTENIILREQLDLSHPVESIVNRTFEQLDIRDDEPVHRTLQSSPDASDDLKRGPSYVGDLEGSSEVHEAAVFILSALVAILSITSSVLWLQRSKMQENSAGPNEYGIISSEPVVDVTAVEERDPCEIERIQMALEDMAANIAREVRSQIEVIEAHHEREMSIMRAIVEETHRTSEEIGSLVKDVIDETSVISTSNNSPCMSPCGDTCSIESSQADGDASSLSVLLETSVTPIRVPLKNRPAITKNKSSIPPTCYSIASPARHSRDRRMKRVAGLGDDSSSEESDRLSVEDSDDDSVTDKENFAHDMVDIWENFRSN
jgi:hypothetical protein